MKKSRMIRSKKVIIALLAAAMTFSIASISAFAAIDTGTKETPIITDIENILRNLQKEAMASKANRAAASYQASITVYPQITGYYCGPASAYSILRSWGVNVPSSTKTLAFFNGCPSSCPYPNVNHICVQSYTSPQVTLADSMGVGYAGADFIMLKNEINSRLPTSYYVYYSVTTDAELQTRLKVTLGDGRPLIAWVHASKLDRYKGSTFAGHYVCPYSYDESTSKVGIADANYMSSYGGKYTENMSTLRLAMYRSSGAANILW